MALTKIMGQNFRTFVDGSAVPEAQSCQVTLSGNMEDSTTKDSDSSWQMESMTSKQWSIQVQNIEATVASLRALITRFNSDSPTRVGFDQTDGAMNRSAKNASFARSGQAILSDLSIQADNRTNIQVTAQYTGNGQLA